MPYSALRHGEFRLLKVHAGHGKDALHCTLEVRSLFEPRSAKDKSSGKPAPEPEPYEALSYAWESFESQHYITIIRGDQPHTVEVYPSLRAALLRLRLPGTSRYLWVDALCINQEDKNEKSAQVREMFRIYSGAREVCVWLGLEKDDSNRAISFIRDRFQDDDSDSIMNDGKFARDWAALSKLMRRPWFSRRWIIQEIALARSATLYCGQESIPWGAFATATSFFVVGQPRIRKMCRVSKEFNYDPHYFGDLDEAAAARLVKLTGHIFSKSDDGDILGKSLPLEELMCSLYMFQTSDPRDALYAIISIAEDVRPDLRVVDETDADSDGEYFFSKHGLVSSSPYEFLSPSSPGPSPIDRRSSSFEAQPLNGNLKRTLTDSRSQDQPPSRRQRIQSLSAVTTSTYTDGINLDGSGPAIMLSEPDQPAFMESPGRVQSPPQSMHLQVRPSWGSTSSVSSADDTKTRALRRWSRNYKAKGIPVDYSKTYYEVCRDVLGFTITASNSLNMMCRPWAPVPLEPSQQLPSWIPTMSQSAFGLAPNGVYVRINADPLVGGPHPGQSFYRSAGVKPALWGIDSGAEGKPCLAVFGFELDTIKSKTSPAISGVIPAEWNEFVQWTDPRNLPPDSFWKTLVGNRDARGGRPQLLWRTACQQAFKLRPQHGDLNVKEAMMYDRRDYVKEFLDRVLRTVWSRRLAVLSKFLPSISLALVPREAKKGDKICIVSGCSVPIVLLKSSGQGQGSYYKMIGECYVHGMMDGEASRYKKTRKIPDQEFWLI
ncbi:hypothetical protein BDV06DRAFT_212249 [Aspergillus oleicola]